jgi:hypothetical protein
MKHKALGISFVAAFALAGCANNFEDAKNMAEDVFGEDVEWTEITEENRPEGTADMEGSYALFSETITGDDDATAAIGDLKMAADFEENTLTGDVKNFEEYDIPAICIEDPIADACTGEKVQDWDGLLELAGDINGDDGFVWEANGDLTGEVDGEEVTLEVGSGGEGGFFYAEDGTLTAYGMGVFEAAGIGEDTVWAGGAALLAQE